MRAILSANCEQAIDTAPPAMVMLREANVPMP